MNAIALADHGFRNELGHTVFQKKYNQNRGLTWAMLADIVVEDVCRDFLPKEDKDALKYYIRTFKFIPGGRYLYYAGREIKAFNNCFILISQEDTREDWADLSWKAESCLTTGGGIGNDYSVYREEGALLKRTGGFASGPISKMRMTNEIGREVMQGGSRRSAIYASLNATHPDARKLLFAKDWQNIMIPGTNVSIAEAKRADFNFPAPLDMTNISLNYLTQWLLDFRETGDVGDIFLDNVRQAMKTGEPGFSFNFFEKEKETGRNAPVSADTWVLTKDGYKQVKDITDQLVEVWTGMQYAPTTFKKTKTMVETINVNMTGGRSITADPEHEFLVERYHGRGSKRRLVSIDRVPAGELQAGDILHVSYPSASLPEFNSEDYTLGFIYGDGSFNNEKKVAELSLCTEDKQACLNFLHGDMIRSTSVSPQGYQRVYFKSHTRFSDANHGVFPMDIVNKASFVAGLFDADGNYDASQNRIRLSSVHKEFLEQTRRVLEELGIMSHINKGSVCGYSGNPSWMLIVSSSSVARFSQIIPTKRLQPKPHSSYRDSKVKVLSTKPDLVQDVFCCDVGVHEHSFMAEGVIISNCTEVTSADDSDVCNLASVNLSQIDNIDEMADVCYLGSQFLLCGTMVADLPYDRVAKVREKNRRLGLGLMGVHEWLIQRGSRYEVTPDLADWLLKYELESEAGANWLADKLGINRPVAYRAIAPTGTIGLLAGTTSGIEPIFAVAYKRRYLVGKDDWRYQYVVDPAAKDLIERYDADPEKIESAIDLADDYERRIKFQADIQDYVDMGISSTINLPAWGSELNNEDRVKDFALTLARYAHRLRGFTCYPDGSRGGQPLVRVPYEEAMGKAGQEFKEGEEVIFQTHDICDISGKGGTCGA